MRDEAALLAAIYAHHDEDTPRLVYADWLDEHGQPERAEFIRLQIEMKRLEHGSRPWLELRTRAEELEAKFRDEWLARLDSAGRKRVRVWIERGMLEVLRVEHGIAADYRVLPFLSGVREVCITDSELTVEAVRDIATLDQLECLGIYRTPFQADWLELLTSLPPWTSVEIGTRGETEFDQAWEAFQQQRIAALASAPVERIRQMLRRRLGNDTYRLEPPPPGPILRSGLGGGEDFDLVALALISELEGMRFSGGNETGAGLRYLTQLPNLREVEFHNPRVNPIPLLAGCAQFERLHLTAENGTLTDVGTEGLERLTNLRDLLLNGGPGVLREGAIRRLAPLKQLRSLELHFGALAEDSLSVLAGLSKLEILKLDGPTRDDDVRHFAGLTNLTCLALMGSHVTDVALRHLTGLTKLRTLFVRRGEQQIAETAARQLAGRLPGLTILLDDRVVKTPTTEIVFQRRSVDEVASVLCPIAWAPPEYRKDFDGIWLNEDGWDHIDSRFDDRSAEIVCDALGFALNKSAGEEVEEYARHEYRTNPQVLERSVVPLAGTDAASCVFREDETQHLLCMVRIPDDRITLICRVTPERFEEFRPLFLFVARSLRVGPAALEGVGEVVPVAVSEL